VRSAPAVNLNANKSKEIQGNPSKKACISLDSFGGIGTFQWVTANPNKKIFSFLILQNYVAILAFPLQESVGVRDHPE
jgi:hypothetical protein